MQAWRITRRIHLASAFTGYGSALAGQRWNSKGVYVVYCASSMALARLEQLVHIGRENAPDDLVAFAVDIPDDAIEVCDAASLPAYWRTEPPPRQLAQRGDAWVLSGTSLALRVPSCNEFRVVDAARHIARRRHARNRIVHENRHGLRGSDRGRMPVRDAGLQRRSSQDGFSRLEETDRMDAHRCSVAAVRWRAVRGRIAAFS